jgi:cytochrome oxidase Cu insertion factor (SCO1/SenC/PrrC family)
MKLHIKLPTAGNDQSPQTTSAKWLLTAGISILVAAGLALLLFWNPFFAPATAAKPLAPEFSLIDAEGQPLKISWPAEKPTVLYFSASWCRPCRAETRRLAQLYEQHRHQFQVVWIGIDPRESNQHLLAHRSHFGHADFRYALDSTTDSVARRYGVLGRGSIVLINPRGEIVFRGFRAVNDPRFIQSLNEVLGRK